jgi:hypothetical protein
MGLRLDPRRQEALEALEPELRAAAGAIGAAVREELVRRAPGLVRAEGGPADGLLLELGLDREPEPDDVSLAACVAAHRAYVTSRGEPDGLSLGALALARLLVWASRASILGPAPRLAWLGPPSRRPEPGPDQVTLEAHAACEVDGRRREARAVALLSPSAPR